MIGQLEDTMKNKDDAIKALNSELQLKQREINQKTQHITELTDLLQSSVKQPMAKQQTSDAKHRMGRL